MKLCVIAPSAEYLQQAGVRIRYQRIQPALAALGHELVLELIDDFRASTPRVHDAYLFSKCGDARAPLLAASLRQAGKPVGIDLFDDYYSQVGSSRFVPQREWMRSMAPMVDFFLCSTARMHDVASAWLACPGHVLNDPFESFDAAAVGDVVEAKLARTQERRQVDIAWFGMGDNPHFPVGLHDLHAFGHMLHQLAGRDHAVHLRVLTNRRALTVAGLERLARLPVPFTLEEWSVEREREVLAQSLVAFLPVNAQNFSTAKSMNRAVTALASGTQVLSAGFPLYEALGDFVYRSPAALLDDIDGNRLALRAQTAGRLGEVFARCADIGEEVRKASAFLEQVIRDTPAPSGRAAPAGVIHGVRTLPDAHKLAQRLNHLSISSPFSVDKLNYDVRFTADGDGAAVQVEFDSKAWPRLDAAWSGQLAERVSKTGRNVRALDISQLWPADCAPLRDAFARSSQAARLAAYQPAMRAIAAIVERLFPGIRTFVSERESPFSSGLGAQQREATT